MADGIDRERLIRAARAVGAWAPGWADSVANHYDRLTAEAAQPKVPAWLTEDVSRRASVESSKAWDARTTTTPASALPSNAAWFRVLLTAALEHRRATYHFFVDDLVPLADRHGTVLWFDFSGIVKQIMGDA